VCGMLCEVWPGMLQSARDGDGGLRLCSMRRRPCGKLGAVVCFPGLPESVRCDEARRGDTAVKLMGTGRKRVELLTQGPCIRELPRGRMLQVDI